MGARAHAASAAARAEVFEDLYRRYWPRLLSYCRYRVDSRDVAEDRAQEVMVRALQYLDSYDPSRSPWPWLRVIADRVMMRHWPKEEREEPWDDRAWLSSQAATPDFTDRIDEHAALNRALMAMPARQRNAIGLKYIDGWSTKEIGRLFRLSRSATDTLLCRARQRLRSEYEKISDGLLGLGALPVIVSARQALARLRARLAGAESAVGGAPALADGMATVVVAVTLGAAGLSGALDATSAVAPGLPAAAVTAAPSNSPPLTPAASEAPGPRATERVLEEPDGEASPPPTEGPTSPPPEPPQRKQVAVSASASDAEPDVANAGANVDQGRDSEGNVTDNSRAEATAGGEEAYASSGGTLHCEGSTVNETSCEAHDLADEQLPSNADLLSE